MTKVNKINQDVLVVAWINMDIYTFVSISITIYMPHNETANHCFLFSSQKVGKEV